jgi:hypothetical protein
MSAQGTWEERSTSLSDYGCWCTYRPTVPVLSADCLKHYIYVLDRKTLTTATPPGASARSLACSLLPAVCLWPCVCCVRRQGENLEQVIEQLKADNSPWAQDCLARMGRMSPTAYVVLSCLPIIMMLTCVCTWTNQPTNR